MPFYDYKCTACGVVFEIKKGMNENIEAKCPKCGIAAQRIFTLFRTIKSAGESPAFSAPSSGSSCSSCHASSCSSCGGA